MQSELWSESSSKNQFEIVGAVLRDQLNKEQVKRIDLSYLSLNIDQWWNEYSVKKTNVLSSATLQKIILNKMLPEHLDTIQSVGTEKTKVAAVLLEYVFTYIDKELANLVHEVMSKIAGIVDIKYPYEEHKELFPKNNDHVASDWGKGYGLIRPHSDDLYEDRDINIMSLTVFKDTSSTPTWFWPIKEIVKCLSDEELGTFALGEALFLSGANVEGISIEKRKPILRLDSTEGIGMRLDFRVDDSIGPRMRFKDDKLHAIFDKMRLALRDLKPISTNPSTGSISILANFKVLHGRSALNPVMLYEGESSRVLFRSKGIKQETA